MKREVKINVKVFSPIHIGNGERLGRLDFFILNHKLYRVDYLQIAHKLPPNLITQLGRILKNSQQHKFKQGYGSRPSFQITPQEEHIYKQIVAQKLYLREIELTGNFKDKDFLEQVNFPSIEGGTNPYIPGSTIKGAIRTALLKLLVETIIERKRAPRELTELVAGLGRLTTNLNFGEWNRIKGMIENFISGHLRWEDLKRNLKSSNCKLNDIQKSLTDLYSSFEVSDIVKPGGFKTALYRAVNIKVCFNHQKNRQQIPQNVVEGIKPGETAQFKITPTPRAGNWIGKLIVEHLGWLLNNFYIERFREITGFKSICPDNMRNCKNGNKNPYYNGSMANYVKEVKQKGGLSNRRFVINLGKFGGNYSKTLSEKVRIVSRPPGKHSYCSNPRFATTRTYATRLDTHYIYYTALEKRMVPFGWLYCEIAN